MDVGVEQGARHLDIAPVDAGHQTELHLHSGGKVLYMGDAEILLGIRSPLGETCDVVGYGALCSKCRNYDKKENKAD